MDFIKFLLNTLKLNFLTYDWFCADGSHMTLQLDNLLACTALALDFVLPEE